MGPLTLDVRLEPHSARTTILARLSGKTLARQTLTVTQPTMSLDIAQGGNSAQGQLSLRLRKPPQVSSVRADIETTGPDGKSQFKGAVATWTADRPPLVADKRLMLSGQLEVRTQVTGFDANTVRVMFYAGSMQLYQISLTQLAPVGVVPVDLRSGQTLVNQGAKLTLTVPTGKQNGQVFLQATIQSRTVPSTDISVAIANWPLP